VIVLDASAAVELFLYSDKAERVAERIAGEEWAAPQLIDLEVLQTLRKQHRLGEIDEFESSLARRSLATAAIERYAHTGFIERIWELRDNLTAYAAAYVALAERLGVPLVTCDGKLGAAPGHRAKINLI
jgi:predicted nucleic acid-binding protein